MREARSATDKSSEHYDPMSEAFFESRSQAYPDMMSKAGNALKSLNEKQKKDRLKDIKPDNLKIELFGGDDHNFEVMRDPLDGNVYLNIDPAQLE